jgi:hypothetical protein
MKPYLSIRLSRISSKHVGMISRNDGVRNSHCEILIAPASDPGGVREEFPPLASVDGV